MYSTEWMFWEKSEKTQGKCPCSRSASVTLSCYYWNQTPAQTFFETCSHLFFVRAISQNIFKGLHIKNLWLFSKYLLLWQSCARTTVKISSEKYYDYFQNIGKILKSRKRNRNIYLQIDKNVAWKISQNSTKRICDEALFK